MSAYREFCLLRDLRDAGVEAPKYTEAQAFEKSISAAAAMRATVTLNGHQLREALDFINPDGPQDRDQLDDDLTFGVRQHKDDDGKISTGMCCWNDDTDGVLPLDGEPQQQATPASALVTKRGLTTLLKAAGAMRLVRCHDGSGEAFEAYDMAIADRVVAELRAEMHSADRHHYHDDPQKQWDEFWAELVAPNGTVDVELVKLELSDFSMLMSYMSHVYDHATGGRISKPNTLPAVVCGVIDDRINELLDDELRDRIEPGLRKLALGWGTMAVALRLGWNNGRLTNMAEEYADAGRKLLNPQAERCGDAA